MTRKLILPLLALSMAAFIWSCEKDNDNDGNYQNPPPEDAEEAYMDPVLRSQLYVWDNRQSGNC